MSRTKHSRIWMLAQYLKPDYYNWKSNNYDYSDKRIVDDSEKCKDASSPYYSGKSKLHYIYQCYQKNYFKNINEYRHSFSDYNYIFNSKNAPYLIGAHLMMRFCFFYFIDTYNNALKYKKKNGHVRPPKVPKIAWIIHDSDKSKDGGIVKPHLHFAFRFSKTVTANQLSKWSGIAPQYFETKSKGRYAFNNELAYLIHAKQPNKHQYSPKKVHANFNYMKVYNSSKDNWRMRAGDVIKKLSHRGASWLEQQVADNPRMTYKHILMNDKLYHIYLTDITTISQILKARADRIAVQTEALIKAKRMNLSVIYIWGKSGVGKTEEADRIISKIQDEHPDWSCYKTAQSSGSTPHPFDSYSGEPIIFFDEARNDDLSAEAWLSLLDALHTNTISARYHNKHLSGRVIILTTPESPIEFFGFMRGVHEDEPLSQFMRRLGIILHVFKVSGKDRVVTYKSIYHLPNPIRITIGSGFGKTTKTTDYYPYPTSASYLSTSNATSKVVSYVDKNTNSGIKHNPGARPLLSSSAADSLSLKISRSSSSNSFSNSNFDRYF